MSGCDAMRGKNSSRWHCKPCDKTSFGSQGRAEETIERSQDFPGLTKPIRAYECPYGNGWHLTKKEQKV